MDEYRRKRIEVENHHWSTDEYITDKEIRRETRRKLKAELPHIEATGTDVADVIAQWYDGDVYTTNTNI